jgi:20S proteasome subunit alpha 2
VNGVVLATEKKNKSILFEDQSTCKIEQITNNIGMVYSGMGPDYRYVLVHTTQDRNAWT